MAKCTNCGQKWTVREIWKLGWSKEGKRCSNCGEKQYLSEETQGLLTLGYISLALLIIVPFKIKLSKKPYLKL
ncbi:hypothetical protein LG275_11130 [Chryseomicrobium palamuruense]